MKKFWVVPMLMLVALAFSNPVMAQDTSMQTDNFEPRANQRLNVLNTDTSDTLPKYKPSVGLFLNYTKDSIQVVDTSTNSVVSTPLAHRLGGDLGFGFGITDRLEIAANLPVVFYQEGNLAFYNGGGDLKASALGDLRVTPKIQLLQRKDEKGLGIAIAAGLYLPTGDEDSFNSDGTLRAEPRLVVDYRTARDLKLIANASYQFRPERQAITYTSGDMVRLALGAELPVAEKLALQATAFNNVNMARSAAGNPMELLGGVKWFATKSAIVQAGAGTGLSSAVGSPKLRLYAGVTYAPVANEKQDATPSECKPCECETCPTTKPEPEPEPEKKPRVIVTKTHIVVSGKVHFDTDKAVIKPQSYDLLMEVAEALNANPHITKIRVEGHTDWRASEAHNQSLSERRAKAVVRFLTRRGKVDPARLTSVGYGESRPIASNETVDGMAKNRRVEFRIIEVNGKEVPPTQEIVTESKTQTKKVDQ